MVRETETGRRGGEDKLFFLFQVFLCNFFFVFFGDFRASGCGRWLTVRTGD